MHIDKQMNFKLFLPVSVFTVLLLSFSACTYDVATPDVCFQEAVLPIFVSKCANPGCHNAQDKEEDYDLSNYDGIMKGIVAGKPNQSELYTEIRYGEMPPSSHTALSKLEKTTIKNWIKLGAPNSANCNTCDSSFTFSGRIKPMMDKWCVGCHNPGNAGGSIDLSTYAGAALSVNNNRLWGSLQHTYGYSAMPQGSSPLSACDLKAVERWLAAGHPNN